MITTTQPTRFSQPTLFSQQQPERTRTMTTMTQTTTTQPTLFSQHQTQRTRTMTTTTHTTLFTRIAHLLVALSMALLAATAGADWGEEALLLQEQLDVNNSFNETLFVGTHNAYNASAWDDAYNADPNQSLDPKDQLRSGAREMEYDIHEYFGQLRLCHGSPCSGGEKKFRRGLEEIKEFINEGNENAVILLKLQIDDDYGEAAGMIEGELGDYIYKPTQGVLDLSGSCGSRYGIEPEFLTKADVLKAGKNVIVITAAEGMDSCPSSVFKEWVHVGVEYSGSGWQKKFDKPTSIAECESYRENGKMTLVHDPNTWIGFGSDFSEQFFDSADTISDYMSCGLNVLEMYNYDGSNSGAHDPDPDDLVWSWNTNEPSGNGNCAVAVGDWDRFDDRPCTNSHPFACYSKADDDWRVTSSLNTWDAGEQTCADEYGSDGYVFAVPTTPPQMVALDEVIDDSGSIVAWVNYHDLSVEGVWQANNDLRLGVESVEALGSPSVGDAFDGFHMVERSLYTGELHRISSVRISAGDRVDGLEVTYDGGTTIQHAGDDGDWTNSLELEAGEHIIEASICIDTYNGSERVFYLSLSTNYGDSISAGTQSGTCTPLILDPVLAFHGRGGTNLDALGFYTRTVISEEAPEIFAMDYNWQGPTSQGDTLFRVDGSIAAATEIGNIHGDHFCASELAFQPGTGTLFGINCYGGAGTGNAIYTLDTETAEATFIAYLWGDQQLATSIAFHPEQPDVLYALNREEGSPTLPSGRDNVGSVLYTIDVTSGETSDVGTLKLGGLGTMLATSIAFTPEGALYGIDDNSSELGGAGEWLFTVDYSSGGPDLAVGIVGALTGFRSSATSIRFDQHGNLYAIDQYDPGSDGSGLSLFKIDLDDATTTQVGAVGYIWGDFYNFISDFVLATSMAIRY